jgi:hypothetical protein
VAVIIALAPVVPLLMLFSSFFIVRSSKTAGRLSAEEILSLKAQFNLNLPSGIAFFEKVNQECMSASRSAAPDFLSRENILQTLLSVCAKGSVEHAFRLQIEKCKAIWLNYFFQGLSQVVRKNINEESWHVLIAAYVQTAEMNKAKTQVMDVLARHDVKAILADGLAPLYKMLESEEMAKSTSAEINNVIAREYNVTGPNIVKITDEKLKTFLTMLQEEMRNKIAHSSVRSPKAINELEEDRKIRRNR